MSYFSNLDYERNFPGSRDPEDASLPPKQMSAPASAFEEDDFPVPQEPQVPPPQIDQPAKQDRPEQDTCSESGDTPADISPDQVSPDAQSEAEDEDQACKAHEAAEARRKAEWDAKQQAKKQAREDALKKIQAMNAQELLKASTARIRTDTEKLTRRNMKECVAEYIQTKCLEDSSFAQLTLLPQKSMVHCFQYIHRKAFDYIQDELKASGFKPGPENTVYGSDIPDDLCYQWAEDYFRDENAKEDQEKDEKFVPKPYVGRSKKSKGGNPKAKEQKKAPSPPPVQKKEPESAQISLDDLGALGKAG